MADHSHITDEAVEAAHDVSWGGEQINRHHIRMMLAAALPVLNTTKDRETCEAIAREFERFADTWGSPMPSPSSYIAQALRDRAAEIRAASLGVSGEDRSEPTPAPGDTVRLHLADGTVITGRLYLDPEDDDRERVEDEHGCGWLVEINGRRRRVEVVTPEDPA